MDKTFSAAPGRLLYSIPGHSPTAYLAPRRVAQLAAMARAGIHAYEIAYALADGWIMPGRYAFDGLDRRVEHVLSLDPRARLLLRVDLHAPEFWYLLHPEDRVEYALAEPAATCHTGDLDSGVAPLRVSLASRSWRRANAAALRALVRHVVAAPYGDHIAGMMSACGTYGEWHYWGFFYLPDVGPAMTAHFRQYLARKYRSAAALSAAWGRRVDSFASVQVPGRDRLQTGRGFLRRGANAVRVRDYLQCHHRLVADTLIGCCRIVKQASGRRLLAGAFHGYFFNTPWRDEAGHLEFRRVVNSPWVDYLAAPQVYDVASRDLGGTALDRALIATVRRRGKLWFSEADTPTHIGRSMKVYWKTRSEIARTPADSVALVRRDAARALAEDHGLWWFDFGRKYQGGEYLHPRIMAEIARLATADRRLAALRPTPVAQLALAYDDGSLYHLNHWRSLQDNVSSGVLDQLANEAQYCGAPVDCLLWDDVEDRHRLVVAANLFALGQAARGRVRRLLCRGGRTVLWMVGPGILGDRGLLRTDVQDLTGMHTVRLRGRIVPEIRFSRAPHPLLVGLQGKVWRYRPAPVWMEKDADLPLPATLSLALAIDDPAAEPLAWWAGTRCVAVAARRCAWGTSVLCALPLVPRTLLRNLLAEAGGHLYEPSGRDVLLASSRVLACHTREGGRRRFALPRAADVVDATTGKRVGTAVRAFGARLAPRSTAIWFLLDPR